MWSGKIDLLEIDITGTLTGQIREDGSTTLIDLVVKGELLDEFDAQSPRPQTETPFEMSGIPPTKIRLTDITVHLKEQHNDSPQTIDLNNMLARRVSFLALDIGLALVLDIAIRRRLQRLKDHLAVSLKA